MWRRPPNCANSRLTLGVNSNMTLGANFMKPGATIRIDVMPTRLPSSVVVIITGSSSAVVTRFLAVDVTWFLAVTWFRDGGVHFAWVCGCGGCSGCHWRVRRWDWGGMVVLSPTIHDAWVVERIGTFGMGLGLGLGLGRDGVWDGCIDFLFIVRLVAEEIVVGLTM